MICIRIWAIPRENREGPPAVPELASVRLVSLLPSAWESSLMCSDGGFSGDIKVPDGDRQEALEHLARIFRHESLFQWQLVVGEE
jgi:hypothetical protein